MIILLCVCPAKIEGNHMNALENNDVIEILDSGDEDDDAQSHSSGGLVNRNTIQMKVKEHNTNRKENNETISMRVSGVQSKPTSTKGRTQLDKGDSNHEQAARNLMKNGSSPNGLAAMNKPRNRDESDKSTSTPQSHAHSSLVPLNGNATLDGSSPINGISTQHLKSSPNTYQKEPIQNAVESHGFPVQHKRGLKCHKRINGKWIEIEIDSQKMLHCSYCIRRFRNLHDLSLHMKKSHENDQYLHDCARCLHQFGQKNERDRHESQCEGRHYQCHLCKVYVTTLKSNMQVHMRVHSGVRPFPCTVCNKSFQTKSYLRYHLNFIHGSMNP